MVAVSTVVGPLIEIPVMLTLVWIALRRRNQLKKIGIGLTPTQKVGKGGVC
jgi:ACR3 family arsenite efflux pump ArsB